MAIGSVAFKVTFLLSTVFDIVVYLLTVLRTFQIVREHRECGARAYLPKLLMRDGKLATQQNNNTTHDLF